MLVLSAFRDDDGWVYVCWSVDMGQSGVCVDVLSSVQEWSVGERDESLVSSC